MAQSLTRKQYSGIMDWLTTVDHKKIGILYFVAGAFFFLIGGLEALLIRIQLWKPMSGFIEPQFFNELITMHGTTMIFLAAMPMILGLMNAIVPLQIGARDVAFPFLNALGFWTFFFGGLLLNLSWIFESAPDVGWTAYTPLSTDAYSGIGVDYYVIGLQIAGIGTLLGGINFIATIINMRAPGLSFMRLPLFTWTSFVTSILILFAFPAFGVGIILLTFDRLFGANFFDVAAGGNSILWQHIFWIFGHPEVYILILPGFGIISEVVSTFSEKRLFGYSSMVFATVLIGFFSFMVWVHHMYTTGLGPIAESLFAVATMLIAVPTGIKVFNWVFTLWGGQIRFTTANLFAVGFIPTFVMGGVTGIMLSVPPADYQFHDSYFVVAHFHYTIVGGIVLGLIAGLFYWWPKIFGGMLNERLGKFSFWTFYTGFHLTFFIQHFLGLYGMQRRIYTYLPDEGWQIENAVSTVGAILMGVGVIAILINVVITSMKKEKALDDPWGGRTLEWTLPSPVPVYNFKQTPLIRSLDAWWNEKQAGNKKMPVAEEVGPIHMPNGSILPFVMSLGFFIGGFGLMYQGVFDDGILGILFGKYIVTIFGFALSFACMILRSLYDDPGYYIEVEEQLEDREVTTI